MGQPRDGATKVVSAAANVNAEAADLLTFTKWPFACRYFLRRVAPVVPGRPGVAEVSRPPSHCPFLNRSDSRCCESFKLDRLQHAFKFCFDKYKTCPVYADLLSERQ